MSFLLETAQAAILNDTPSPNLGEHNELVYSRLLGLSEAKIGQLKEDGVI